MTECSGCGSCCEGFPLNTPYRADVYGKAMLASIGRTGHAHEPTAWSGEGRKMLAWMANLTVVGGPRRSEPNSEGRTEMRYTYSCPVYDRHTRRCTDYANRPAVCRGFPWYGKPVTRDSIETISKVCSFVADTGRTVLPIVEVR